MRNCLAILVTLVACKDHDLEQLSAIKAELCACKTAGCAEQAMKRVPRDTIKASPRARTLAREMMDCMARIHDAARPSTDPDAEDSPETAPDQGSAAAAPAPPAAGTAPASPPAKR